MLETLYKVLAQTNTAHRPVTPHDYKTCSARSATPVPMRYGLAPFTL